MIATRRFALAALAVGLGQTAILGYMVESRASILRYGTEILLQTALVDPRDLLRGDYVILSYDISTIPAALVTGERPVGDEKMPLQVRLRPGPDGFWTVSEASFQPLPAIDASVVMHTLPLRSFDVPSGTDGTVWVTYGIESYYVPEGEGRPIEDGRNTGRVSVAVRVSESGQPQIRALMLDGAPLYQEPLY